MKTATVLTLALFWSRPFLIAADAPKHPLWRKAVAVATANADWVPGLVITRSEVLHKGEAVGVHEMWQRSKLGPKGEVVTETVKVLEDGKDVTKPEITKSVTATSTMSVMFIKADVRMTTTFSEHWKKPQHETTPGNDRH